MHDIPTDEDWGSKPLDLDAADAYRTFHGKTYDQAIELFRREAMTFQEDVLYMPSRCFPFYMNALLDYLNSPEAVGDSDGANAFIGLVNFRQNDVINLDGELRGRTMDTLRFIGQNQEWYDADESIYGLFSKRSTKLLVRISDAAASQGGG